MDAFYLIVLAIATCLLIIILTYVGILMNKKSEGAAEFPPNYSTCPDYWSVNQSDATKCVVPLTPTSSRNVGSMFDNRNALKLSSANTPGLASGSINFSHVGWSANGNNICAKKTWANTYGIVWDGVTNYTKC